MNIQLRIFLGKSFVSLADIRLLFSALDCSSPSVATLRKSVTAVVETWTKLNQGVVERNCQIIRNMSSTHQNKVTVMTDTVYNNAPKGRGTYQPGTQSVTPMVHSESRLVVSVSNLSKLCPKNNLACTDNDCPANFEHHRAMDSREVIAATQNFKNCRKMV